MEEAVAYSELNTHIERGEYMEQVPRRPTDHMGQNERHN